MFILTQQHIWPKSKKYGGLDSWHSKNSKSSTIGCSMSYKMNLRMFLCSQFCNFISYINRYKFVTEVHILYDDALARQSARMIYIYIYVRMYLPILIIVNHGNKIAWVKDTLEEILKTIDVQMIDVYDFAYLNS